MTHLEDGAAVPSGSVRGSALGRSNRIAVIQLVSGVKIADGGPSYSIPRLLGHFVKLESKTDQLLQISVGASLNKVDGGITASLLVCVIVVKLMPRYISCLTPGVR